MEKSELRVLDLRMPLFFEKKDSLSGDFSLNSEFLLCYSLDPVQSCNFEPDPCKFLDSLIFCGQKMDGSVSPTAEKVSLPAGKYLFVQYRVENQPSFSAEEWLNMAIEQQKDGLWERHKPGSRLFVRFLHEDKRYVIQFFRSFT